MDLNLLREFAALAEHLNFSKTAQALNLTQPTLSRHIVQLEEELKVQLFRRDRQSVSLTEVGELFLAEANAVLARYDVALRRVRDYRDSIAGTLTVGYRWPSGGPSVFPAFRAHYPQVSLRLVSFQDAGSLRERVLDGTLDAAILLRPDDVLSSQFQRFTLCSVPLCAVMREDHPLAGREAVTPAELAGERLLVPQTRTGMGFPALMNTLFRPCGRIPSISYSAERLEEAYLRVQLDHLVSLVPQCYFPDTGLPGLYAERLTGTEGLFRLLVIASADTENPAVRLFFETCRAEVKEPGTAKG